MFLSRSLETLRRLSDIMRMPKKKKPSPPISAKIF